MTRFYFFICGFYSSNFYKCINEKCHHYVIYFKILCTWVILLRSAYFITKLLRTMYDVKNWLIFEKSIRESYFFFKHKADMLFCLITSKNNTRYPNHDVLNPSNILSKHIFQFFLIVCNCDQQFLNFRTMSSRWIISMAAI